MNVPDGDESPPRVRLPNGHRPGVPASETRDQTGPRDEIGPGFYRPWTRTLSIPSKGWVGPGEPPLSGGTGSMFGAGRTERSGVQGAERHGGQSVGTGSPVPTARVCPRALSVPLTQMKRSVPLLQGQVFERIQPGGRSHLLGPPWPDSSEPPTGQVISPLREWMQVSKHTVGVMRTRWRPRHTTRHAHQERWAGQGREEWSRRRCPRSHGSMAANRRVL